jgi:hypothetical protein
MGELRVRGFSGRRRLIQDSGTGGEMQGQVGRTRTEVEQ